MRSWRDGHDIVELEYRFSIEVAPRNPTHGWQGSSRGHEHIVPRGTDWYLRVEDTTAAPMTPRYQTVRSTLLEVIVCVPLGRPRAWHPTQRRVARQQALYRASDLFARWMVEKTTSETWISVSRDQMRAAYVLRVEGYVNGHLADAEIHVSDELFFRMRAEEQEALLRSERVHLLQYFADHAVLSGKHRYTIEEVPPWTFADHRRTHDIVLVR